MKDFAQRLNDVLNYGAINLALGIGYRLQIFDALEELNRPVTIAELADVTGLNARYLKEWLGVMVTGEVIKLSSSSDDTDQFYLPPDHAAVLTRKAGSDNMGVYAQEIPLLTACAMEPVIRGFQTGDGVPFSNYPEFQAFMAELSDSKQEKILVDFFLPSVDDGKLINRLESGISVCDVGCGQGVAVILMARAYPDSVFTGIDNHTQAIRVARESADRLGLANAEFKEIDAATIHQNGLYSDQFDYICAFDAIHDQSHPLEALKSVKYMLAPGGLFSMVDIKARSSLKNNLDHPMAPFLYTVSLTHCMPIGLDDNGAGLGMMWGMEKAKELLTEAGFSRVELKEMAYDSFNIHFLCQ